MDAHTRLRPRLAGGATVPALALPLRVHAQGWCCPGGARSAAASDGSYRGQEANIARHQATHRRHPCLTVAAHSGGNGSSSGEADGLGLPSRSNGSISDASISSPPAVGTSNGIVRGESSSGSGAPARDSLEVRLAAACSRLTSGLPLWVVIAATAAMLYPPAFIWLPKGLVSWGLGLTMLGMGLTMRLEEFGAVLSRTPMLLLLGLSLQYTVMPLLGWVFSRYAGLEQPLAVGVALLSACPGGTASNIVAFIAKGEMALSIMMTTASTLTAVVATPVITSLLAGTMVHVDAAGLFVTTLQVVLAPVVLGALLNQRFPSTVRRISAFTPLAAAVLVAFIVGSTLAYSADAVKQCGPRLLGAVAALHASGFAIGYLFSKGLGLSEKICRTNSIEVGMQNSTLGAVLAAVHFADPLVAAPCALSACTHSVMGSLLAGYWASRPDGSQQAGGDAPQPALGKAA